MIVFDDGRVDLERFGHERAQLIRVGPVSDDEELAVAKAVRPGWISRTGERHGKSALTHLIFFHDVLSVLTQSALLAAAYSLRCSAMSKMNTPSGELERCNTSGCESVCIVSV